MSWQTPKTDWNSTDYVNASDFNRIEENTQDIADLIGTYKATPSLTGVKTDWANTDFPYYDQLNKIESNIETCGLSHGKPTEWISTKT